MAGSAYPARGAGSSGGWLTRRQNADTETFADLIPLVKEKLFGRGCELRFETALRLFNPRASESSVQFRWR
jgi:hypothetical protein